MSDEERTEKADKVSFRIAEILSETAFSFFPNEYISIHRKLFQGIYKHAEKIRDYNITKKEYKEFYMPKNKPEIVTVPKANYIAVRGKRRRWGISASNKRVICSCVYFEDEL